MDIHSLLKKNNEKLLKQYKENLELTLSLQKTLIHEVLPHLQDELQLGTEVVAWAKEWFEDTPSVFQFLRRHKFTKSFALEAIRQNLVWRIDTIYPSLGHPPIPLLHCLPGSVSDPFGRPIILLKVSALAVENGTDDFKRLFMPTIDLLQAHLKCLNESRAEGEDPILQYSILLDLSDVSMQNIDINLLTWAMRDVIPRFPGMIAGVFMLNYSWTHSGLWTIAKRVLPAAALSRIFFPTKKELADFFGPSSLPKEYGGSLPHLDELEDPLRPDKLSRSNGSADPSLTSSISSRPANQTPSTSFVRPVARTVPHHPEHRSIEGLLKTLARLWWERWKVHMNVFFGIAVVLLAARMWRGRGGNGLAGKIFKLFAARESRTAYLR